MINFPDYNQETQSWFKNINFAKFYHNLVKEKNLELVVSSVEEIQKFVHNKEEYKKKWLLYLQEFDIFCEKMLSNPEFSEKMKKEFAWLIADFRYNLEIQIKYSSSKNFALDKVNKFKLLFSRIFG